MPDNCQDFNVEFDFSMCYTVKIFVLESDKWLILFGGNWIVLITCLVGCVWIIKVIKVPLFVVV